MESVVFRQPRQITDATKIPLLGWHDRVYLIRTGQGSSEAFRAGGARVDSKGGWYVRRDADVLLGAIDQFLPHLARKAIVPNVVDLIPETSWCSSLANMLTSTSWGLLRDVVLARAGGCEDCGAKADLECHEFWTYDEVKHVQKLVQLRSLCADCHETYHLGYANVQGRYDLAFRRLVVMNRILKHEEEDFESEIFDKFMRRSEVEWTLDLAMLKGTALRLKSTFQEVAPNLLMGDTRKGEVEVSLKGVKITKDGKQVVLS
jgi:hypothetical protein